MEFVKSMSLSELCNNGSDPLAFRVKKSPGIRLYTRLLDAFSERWVVRENVCNFCSGYEPWVG